MQIELNNEVLPRWRVSCLSQGRASIWVVKDPGNFSESHQANFKLLLVSDRQYDFKAMYASKFHICQIIAKTRTNLASQVCVCSPNILLYQSSSANLPEFYSWILAARENISENNGSYPEIIEQSHKNRGISHHTFPLKMRFTRKKWKAAFWCHVIAFYLLNNYLFYIQIATFT